MSGRLLHYTSEPLEVVRSVAQPAAGHFNHGGGDMKPAGLWVSVEGEDDWLQWCEGESFGNPGAQLCYEIALVPDAPVLRIDAPARLIDFTREFGFDRYEGKLPVAGHIDAMHWAKVAERYAGIIIAPYCWQQRLESETFWYYSWDCASGCIWDATAGSGRF